MKKFLYPLCLFLIFTAGCSLVSGKHGMELRGRSAEKVKKAAAPMIEKILNSFNSGDYSKYSEDFSEDTRVHMSRPVFEQQREKYLSVLGKYRTCTLDRVNKHGPYKTAVYDAVFEKGTMKVKLILEENGDRFLISGLWFDEPVVN